MYSPMGTKTDSLVWSSVIEYRISMKKCCLTLTFKETSAVRKTLKVGFTSATLESHLSDLSESESEGWQTRQSSSYFSLTNLITSDHQLSTTCNYQLSSKDYKKCWSMYQLGWLTSHLCFFIFVQSLSSLVGANCFSWFQSSFCWVPFFAADSSCFYVFVSYLSAENHHFVAGKTY